MKRLAKEWDEFCKQVMPSGASETQVLDMRAAYYAGALSIFALILNNLTPDKEPTEADVKVLDELYEELKEFFPNAMRDEAYMNDREIEDYCENCGANEEDGAQLVICRGFLVCADCAESEGSKLAHQRLAESKDALNAELRGSW